MVSTTRKVLMLGSFYGSGRKLGRRKNSGGLHETVAASITTATTCGVHGCLFPYHCAVRWWRWLVVVAMVVVGRGRSGGLFDTTHCFVDQLWVKRSLFFGGGFGFKLVFYTNCQ